MQVDRLHTCGSLVIDVKVCGIIGISKIEFFNFSGTERVKFMWLRNQNQRRNHIITYCKK